MYKKLNNLIFILLFFCIYTHKVLATKFDDFYIKYFLQYQNYYTNTPVNADAKFLTFIYSNTHLADKLRQKWLYTLAQNKQWDVFMHHYKPTEDVNLQCLYERARYEQGDKDSALQDSVKIWLSPESSPPGCNKLFEAFESSKYLTNKLVKKRIKMALRANNPNLARYLMLKYKPQALQANKTLAAIQKTPLDIKYIKPGLLNNEIFLYGLNKISDSKREVAQKIWLQHTTQQLLTRKQKQLFLVNHTINKARKQDHDTEQWFIKISPKFYSHKLLEWQARFFIGKEKWPSVIKTINIIDDKNEPIWQYWLARAYEKTNRKSEADKIFKELSLHRGYYGFLSSYKLNTKPEFNEEKIAEDPKIIEFYQPILDDISTKYHNRKFQEASQETNDFTSMLPHNQKIAVISWLETKLRWYSKAINLSQEDSLYHQLTLRFPIAYQEIIDPLIKKYNVNKSLVLSIIKQESSFNSEARSEVGALGLMQLMPGVTKVLAKQEKITIKDPKVELIIPNSNIKFGIIMLRNLKKSFHNQPLLMAAAYNGGPTAVRNWLKTYPSHETDIWIELLPWQETREYMKNIMAFHIVYDYLTNKTIKIKEIISIKL